MPDMLVKLYELPNAAPQMQRMADLGITVRRPIMPEMEKICDWTAERFSERWAAQVRGSFANDPPSLYIAARGKQILGFACYESTYRDFFGPIGVEEKERTAGIGTALLLCCLRDMKDMGYAYAVIGSVGPAAFYEKVCGAEIIENSSPGVYGDRIDRI